MLDDLLLRVVRDHLSLPAELEQAWSIMVRAHGAVSIAELADTVGWSRRLSQQFRRAYGLPPKVMARVVRFERAQHVLRSPTRPSLASVAHACGYADQAHMTREWVELAGSPPTEWLGDETIPFVQDDDRPIVAP